MSFKCIERPIYTLEFIPKYLLIKPGSLQNYHIPIYLYYNKITKNHIVVIYHKKKCGDFPYGRYYGKIKMSLYHYIYYKCLALICKINITSVYTIVMYQIKEVRSQLFYNCYDIDINLAFMNIFKQLYILCDKDSGYDITIFNEYCDIYNIIPKNNLVILDNKHTHRDIIKFIILVFIHNGNKDSLKTKIDINESIIYKCDELIDCINYMRDTILNHPYFTLDIQMIKQKYKNNYQLIHKGKIISQILQQYEASIMRYFIDNIPDDYSIPAYIYDGCLIQHNSNKKNLHIYNNITQYTNITQIKIKEIFLMDLKFIIKEMPNNHINLYNTKSLTIEAILHKKIKRFIIYVILIMSFIYILILCYFNN